MGIPFGKLVDVLDFWFLRFVLFLERSSSDTKASAWGAAFVLAVLVFKWFPMAGIAI